MKRLLAFRIQKDVYDQLKQIALQEQTSVSLVLRKILENHFFPGSAQK